MNKIKLNNIKEVTKWTLNNAWIVTVNCVDCVRRTA